MSPDMPAGADLSRTGVTARLAEKGLALPAPVPALFNYVPYVVSGPLVFIAGQVPVGGVRDFKGKVGIDLDMETALEAAQLCGLNILSQIDSAIGGDWSRVTRCVKLGGFVNCAPDFEDHSLVINAASDLMVDILGESRGKHARFAVGAPALPANFAVEIDAVFEVSPE